MKIEEGGRRKRRRNDPEERGPRGREAERKEERVLPQHRLRGGFGNKPASVWIEIAGDRSILLDWDVYVP